MAFRILADLIVIVHALFVLFVLFGGVLVMYNKSWVWLHIPAVIWGAVVEFMDWICPLTPLENWLRIQGGGTAYTSDFVERYLLSFLYPSFLTHHLQCFLGLIVVVANICMYGWIIRRKRSSNQTST